MSTIRKHKSHVHFRNLFANFVVLCQIQVELLASGIAHDDTGSVFCVDVSAIANCLLLNSREHCKDIGVE